MASTSTQMSEQLSAALRPTPPAPQTGTQYILYYRQGANPHPQFLFFWHASTDMKVIAERAKRHCEVMNYRFVYVRPSTIDLDKEENFLINRG